MSATAQLASSIPEIARYRGLHAAVQRGDVAALNALIASGASIEAPLDHVNNLQWTAVIEAVAFGDGSNRHVKVVEALLLAGADVSLTGRTALMVALAKSRGYSAMVRLFDAPEVRSD